MSDTFPVCELGDVAELFDSLHQTPSYVDAGYPMIRVTDIRRGYVETKKAVRVDEQTYLQFSKKHQPKAGDIIFSRVGSYGNSAYVRYAERFCLGQNTVCITPDQAQINPFFLYSVLNSPEVRNQIESLVGGASQGTISLKNIRKLKVPIPNPEIQRRIAGILSAYDNLIENSQRRIEILEEMARSLYREWFVNFRYPGHESVPLVPSPLGEIPQGWKVANVGDTFQTILGGTPSRARPEYWHDGTIPWINSGKVNELRITQPSEFITQIALEKSAAKLMPKGTTVLAITGATLGQVSYLEIDTTANQSVVGIVDRTGQLSEWIYLTVVDRIGEIIKKSSGGAQQHINKEIVNETLLSVPPNSLARSFKACVAPMFDEIAVLLNQVNNLRATRDLLLPRLISGQLEVTVD